MLRYKLIGTVVLLAGWLRGYPQAGMTVQTNGRFMYVNHQPFFPIGLYAFPDKRDDDAMWKEAADAGINFMMAKTAGKYGIKVSRPIPKIPIDGKNRSLMEVQLGRTVQQQLLSFLQQHEQDTTMVCWHAPDEPSWFGPSGQILMNGYSFVKKHTQKPVWLNIGPSFTAVENYNNAATFVASSDILSEDIYPVPDAKSKQGQGSNQNMALVGEHTGKLVNLAKTNDVQTKPIWMVLQAFGWASLKPIFNNPDDFVPPTRHELRYMVYDAIVNGATGIVFWGLEFESTAKPSGLAIWNDVKAMATELKANYTLLTSMTDLMPSYLIVSAGEGAAATTNTTNPIKYRMTIVGSDVFVMAVNSSPQPVRGVQFTVSTAFKGQVDAVINHTTNQTVPVSNNRFWQDDIEGYGVRIYKTRMRFNFLKP